MYGITSESLVHVGIRDALNSYKQYTHFEKQFLKQQLRICTYTLTSLAALLL